MYFQVDPRLMSKERGSQEQIASMDLFFGPKFICLLIDKQNTLSKIGTFPGIWRHNYVENYHEKSKQIYIFGGRIIHYDDSYLWGILGMNKNQNFFKVNKKTKIIKLSFFYF